jgi:minor extracellular serine protease Vpr
MMVLLGVAPGVELNAVKVCSSVDVSCSGTALLLQGIDFAADPNGDGIIEDCVDIISMSL